MWCSLHLPLMLCSMCHIKERLCDLRKCYVPNINCVFSSHSLLLFIILGFISLPLTDQMNLLQSTWLDVLCFNLAYRSTPYKGVLVYADDFKCTETESKKFGSPNEMDTVTRRLARKLSDMNITKEEYVLMKSMLLLNPGLL